jgi:GNAT superfamily N-acetyltransferase
MRNAQHRNIQIRLAKPGDENVIAAVLSDAFTGYRYLYTEDAFEATILGITRIKERINNKTMWVALFNNIVRATLSLTVTDNKLYIRSVAVSPIMRRKGLAMALMIHAEEEALKMGYQQLELTTTSFLFEAMRLYEHFGFERYGYEDLFGTRLIKMRKNLGPGSTYYSLKNLNHGTSHAN